MKLIATANQLFKEKKYNEAYFLYIKAKKEHGFNCIDYNIKLCESMGASEESLEFINLSKKFSPMLYDKLYSNGIIENSLGLVYKELVSIIIPSYNNANYLKSAINSALSQEGVNTEVILVDDGSTDNSIEIASEIAKDFENFKIISLLRNFGCYYARNIGVLNSKGDYITIVDSDDIMPPHRILTQMNALKSEPNAVAVRCMQKRYSADYAYALSELKAGENSLLWKRSIIDLIGYYDTVRYSGDAEFRKRIECTFGLKNLITIEDELYFTRTVKNSLTTSKDSGVFAINNNNLQVNISPPRKLYADAFTNWQKQNKPKGLSRKGNMYTNFPLFRRKFDLGQAEQNASPSLNQKVVGMLASFLERRKSLEVIVERILPQLDELNIYLNDYEEIPSFLKNKKINVILGKKALGDLRDNAKFYNLPKDKNTYIFTFDDDLAYPPDYVARMIHYIEMFNRKCFVGVHGVIYPANLHSFEQRDVFHFKDKGNGRFVDVLGTGTTAWHSSLVDINLNNFSSTGVCDLEIAAIASKHTIPMYCIPKEKSWLREYVRYEKRLYKEALDNPTDFIDKFNSILKSDLNKAQTRKIAEQHLSSAYSSTVLNYAGVEISATKQESTDAQNLHFHIIVNGWNCIDYIDKSLSSIAQQTIGQYTYDITLIDDGSDDGSIGKLYNTSLFPNAKIIKITKNMGPAYARHIGISDVVDPDTVIVLIDMDDSLKANALNIVAKKYIENPNCLMTIGNWIDQNNKLNPQDFYTEKEINNQTIRDVELFNATHLRTFKRKLYDAITEEDLKDKDGNWFTVCTDVALMYPLIDQCWANEIEFITEPIYKYTRNSSSGTLARFGKPYKVEKLSDLKSRSPKTKLFDKNT